MPPITRSRARATARAPTPPPLPTPEPLIPIPEPISPISPIPDSIFDPNHSNVISIPIEAGVAQVSIPVLKKKY
jgi:hypothetical protein